MNSRLRAGLSKIKYAIKTHSLVNDFYLLVVYTVNDILAVNLKHTLISFYSSPMFINVVRLTLTVR